MLEKLLNQVILYGGIPLTRRQVIQVMKEEGFSDRAIDFFAFGPSPAPVEQVTAWEHVPLEEKLRLAKD